MVSGSVAQLIVISLMQGLFDQLIFMQWEKSCHAVPHCEICLLHDTSQPPCAKGNITLFPYSIVRREPHTYYIAFIITHAVLQAEFTKTHAAK